MAFISVLDDDSIDIIFVQYGAVVAPFVQEENELILSVLEKESYNEIPSEGKLYLKINKLDSTYNFVDHILEKRNQEREYISSRKEILKHFNSYPQKIITIDLERLLDTSIPANTQLDLEKFKSAGFNFINKCNTSKFARINFIRETIQFITDWDTSYNIKDANKLFDYYYVTPEWFRHEALHTTNVLLENVNDHLLEHHYYDQGINPEYNSHIDRAISALSDAYQAVGLDGENEVKKYMKNIFRATGLIQKNIR